MPPAEQDITDIHCMPLNDTDKAWIREAIQSAHAKRGWGAFTRFIKEWFGFGAFVGLIVFIATQWTTYIEFRTTTNLTLASIDKRLGVIEGRQARETVESHAALKPQEFQSTLAELGPAIATVKQYRELLPSSTVSAIRDKLMATDAATPGYWTATSQLVSYRSGQIDTSLPDCGKTIPEHLIWVKLDHPELKNDPPPDQVKFTGCLLNLDLSLPASAISPTQTDAVSIVCQHCKIIYSGGVVPLLRSRGYVNMIFDDCIFNVNASDESPIRGKRLIATILAASDSKQLSYSFFG